MWRQLEIFVRKADERSPLMVDAAFAVAATAIITLFVRSFIG
jgi:hypothetical protein